MPARRMDGLIDRLPAVRGTLTPGMSSSTMTQATGFGSEIDGLGTQARHRLQRRTLVAGILVYGSDQLRNQVVTTLQLDIDITPGRVNAIPIAHQLVVKQRRNQREAGNDDDCPVHGVSNSPPWVRETIVAAAAVN